MVYIILWFGIFGLLVIGVPTRFDSIAADGSLKPIWFLYCITTALLYMAITFKTIDIKEKIKESKVQITTIDEFNFTILDTVRNLVIRTTSQDMMVIYYTYSRQIKIYVKTATVNNKDGYKIDIRLLGRNTDPYYLLDTFSQFGIKTVKCNDEPSSSID